MVSPRTSILINVLLSYINWFAVALLAGLGKPLLALIPSLVVVGIHFLIVSAEQKYHEMKVLITTVVCGLLVETVFVNTGTINYSSDVHWPFLPPVFMIGLWAAFSTMFTTSLLWLHSRAALTAGIGFLVSGPSYYAGEKLGALSVARPLHMSLIEIGALWFFVLPLLLYVARRP